mgnify:CR=1 FL=1
MEDIKVYCENTQAYESVALGTTLQELCRKLGCADVLAALVDNKLKSLDYKVIGPHNVRFVGYEHPDGRRTYIRSLCFVLQKVVREMFPEKVLVIDYSLPSGLYCEIREAHNMDDGRPCVYFVTDSEVENIEARMREIIAADLRFGKKMLSLQECCQIYESQHQAEKANLLKTLGRFNYNVYMKKTMYSTLWQLVTGQIGTEALSGPISTIGAIGGIVKDTAEYGESTGESVRIAILAITELLSIISLNLAIMNLLPLPALDGFRLISALFEGITKKHIPRKVEGIINTVGLLLIVGLMLLLEVSKLF